MKRSIAITAIAAIAVVSFVAGRLVSQTKEETKEDEKKKKETEAMMAYATPGKEHELLAKLAGKWSYTGKMWMEPSSQPIAMTGKAEFKMVLGGRYRMDETKGDPVAELGGQPFTGISYTGFDNFKKKYFSTWIDDMSTGILAQEGTVSKDGKEFVYHGEQPDLMEYTGKNKMLKMRSTETRRDDDHFTFSFYMPDPDGKEYKMMQLDYTRQK